MEGRLDMFELLIDTFVTGLLEEYLLAIPLTNGEGKYVMKPLYRRRSTTVESLGQRH